MQLTELHMALIAGGLGFILLVWAVNLWQERKLRKKIEHIFGAHKQDILLAKKNMHSIEPQLPENIGSAPQPITTQNYFPPAESLIPILDEQTDCIVELQPEISINGEQLQQMAQRLRHAGSKPIQFEGWDEENAQWQRPEAKKTFQKLRAGILLANRNGPLNAIEFSDFLTHLETIANDITALPDFPSMGQTLNHAQKLDHLFASWDVQISLNILLPENQYAPEALQSIVLNRGYIERPDGKYLMLDNYGQVVFTSTLNLQPPQITLLLDVPRANPQIQPFDRMAVAANDLAQNLGGIVVDDALRTIDPSALLEIEQQLRTHYAEMAEAGVPAGSALALRIFN